MNRQELLQAAVEKWGIQSQVMMAIEEMGELLQAISKVHRNGNNSIYNLLEEIADVRIMMDQLVLIFEPSTTMKVSLEEEIKLQRLAFRLETTYEADA